MSATTSRAVALSPPSGTGWDFGDYPYGLEPLTLPRPGESIVTGGPDLAPVCRELVAAVRERRLGTVPAGPRDLERLFWFRWMIGHHVSFVIWRLLAEAVGRLSDPDTDQVATARAITWYVRGYSAMLLYTASSTRKIYNSTIRPSMYRLHDTFSGTWAADFAPVRSVFRSRRVPPVPPSELAALREEVALGHRIHLGVASKLVRDGRSLLQHLVDHPAAHQPRMWGAIFDCYFLTVREPVSEHEVTVQMLRRCKAVLADLATNGLRPAAADYPEPVPEELRTPRVRACERDLVDIVLRMATLAVSADRGR
ncbi:hypothetical protein [Actinophytocola sp. KF-1]